MNQPTGFFSTGSTGRRPSYYYGRRHEYIYYPVAWVDSSTGKSYQQGYYDENGERYDNVAFEKDGKYENVVCHCEYCGLDTVMDLSADAASKTLQCPNCGAPMEIKSLLDQELRASSAVSDTARPAARKRSGWQTFWIILLITVIVLYLFARISMRSEYTSSGGSSSYGVTEVAPAFGDRVVLTRTGEGEYRFVSGGAADKTLVWDRDSESYYDSSTECWVWLNTDMDPPVWQYWYEGISSDYGDYGWMEHDETGWYIEASYGDWIELPAKYDAGSLWYIGE